MSDCMVDRQRTPPVKLRRGEQTFFGEIAYEDSHVLVIKGDMTLSSNTWINKDLIVEGNILSEYGARFDLNVDGDIRAKNTVAQNISAKNVYTWKLNVVDSIRAFNVRSESIISPYIYAWDIETSNIDSHNINAQDINAHGYIKAVFVRANFIVCETLDVTGGVEAISIIENRNSYKQKKMEKVNKWQPRRN